MNIRSEETKRSVTFRVTQDDHEITITLSAQCHAPGSAEAVADAFTHAREQLERTWKAEDYFEYEQMLKAVAREVDPRSCRDCGHIHGSGPCSCGCRVAQVCLAP